MQIVTPSGDEEFARYFDLRWRMLREPWGQPRGSERDALEQRSWHFMACAEDRLPIGVARLHLNSPEQAQIRYMAVEPGWRNQGVGRALVRAAEECARGLAVREIVLQARGGSVPFYRRLGYEETGPGATLFDAVAHVAMRKALR